MFVFPTASLSIASDYTADHKHFVIPSSPEERKRAPQILVKARKLCPSGVNITLYSPSTSFSENMDVVESSCVNKSKNIPSPLTETSSENDASNTNTDYDGQFSTPLTPRTALLATNSKLNAKSPEFTPFSSIAAKNSSDNSNARQKTQPDRESSVGLGAACEDLGVPLRRPVPIDDSTNVASGMTCESDAPAPRKRGEKRKSGQQFEECEMTEDGDVAPNSDKDNNADNWMHVRNRNKSKTWGDGKTAYTTANRYTLQHQSSDSDLDRSMRKRGKRTCTGDVRKQHNDNKSGVASSQVDNVPNAGNDKDDDCSDDGASGGNRRELKRLKSVGSVMPLLIPHLDCVLICEWWLGCCRATVSCPNSGLLWTLKSPKSWDA